MVLPSSDIDISNGVVFENQPSLTWLIDKKTGRIKGEANGINAVRQAIEIILNVERFRWQIFSPYSGMQWQGLIGAEPGYVALEMKRRVGEALKMDNRIIGISKFNYRFAEDEIIVDLLVQTVYGNVAVETEVHAV